METYSYDVFGEPTIRDANDDIIADSNFGNPYMFTSRRYDPEAGLYYYRARYYAHDIGRFLQPDPIGYTDGLNMYAYCGNNPINFVDPFGLCKDSADNWSRILKESIYETWLDTKQYGRNGLKTAKVIKNNVKEYIIDTSKLYYHTAQAGYWAAEYGATEALIWSLNPLGELGNLGDEVYIPPTRWTPGF